LERLTGEKDLITVPGFPGGGVHSIQRGGFLGMHTDFTWNESSRVYRRLNLLLYLNRDWGDWGGELCLGSSKRIRPEANTMVVFTTDDKSWHGHPEPLRCPADVTRDSIAVYYYSATEPAGFVKRATTNYGQ
jgi:Rps23 Pro-64 3,4-dihydroxylase Tpa1-like proline 4-hydroxylase